MQSQSDSMKPVFRRGCWLKNYCKKFFLMISNILLLTKNHYTAIDLAKTRGILSYIQQSIRPLQLPIL